MSDVFVDTERVINVSVEPVTLPVVSVGASGPMGPPGPTGATGPQGATGPRGPSGDLGGAEVFYIENVSTKQIQLIHTQSAPLVYITVVAGFDGSPVWINGYVPGVQVMSGATLGLDLYEDGAVVGTVANFSNGTGGALTLGGIQFMRKLTPTGGSHSFSLRGWCQVATGAFVASPAIPSFLRGYHA